MSCVSYCVLRLIRITLLWPWCKLMQGCDIQGFTLSKCFIRIFA
nr:MAG TPA: hypothetical protein [Caudoviricetes sp.]